MEVSMSTVGSASRRDFLKVSAEAATALVALSACRGTRLLGREKASAGAADPLRPDQRQQRVFELRRDAAKAYLQEPPVRHATNGDEERYKDRRASFSKTLPHNQFGEVTPDAYQTWLAILTRGDPEEFERVPRAPDASVKLNNPQATYAFDLVGVDPAATRLPPPPAFASAQMAIDMAEVYWQALTLDVPFRDYESHRMVAAAVTDLNAFSQPVGATAGRKVTPATLFRGETAGTLTGPYVSQLLWLDVPYGIKKIDQRYEFPSRGQGFLTDYSEWLACQQGMQPKAKLRFDAQPRFICSNRELAEYVHRDFSYQPYLNAALIMMQFGQDAWSPTNPYRGSKSQFGDITFGRKDVLTLVVQGAMLGQKGSYYHKWQVHRRLRPETFAGRIETHLSGKKKYDIHTEILNCDAVARLLAANGTRLLPGAFPEGCPTHPSYPAAHACTAGACATILKAFFNEAFAMPKPVDAKADGSALEPWQGKPLTLGNEIDKLACNISLGRDAAGVHYRSDSIQGLFVGEQQALGLLCDYSRTYNERFEGFVLTKFDGKKIKIAGGKVVL
jgi:hypothetical protein